MPPSDRFKPIQKLNSQRERNAASQLGKSLTTRDDARRKLDDLKEYLAEYRERYAAAVSAGLPGAQVREYQMFITKLENAIVQQQQIVSDSERRCDSSKQDWRGRYSKQKAMDNAVDRMRLNERKNRDKQEQSEADERSQRKR